MISPVTAAPEQEAIRAAALAWSNDVTVGGTVPITREHLASDFVVGGRRFPLVDRGATAYAAAGPGPGGNEGTAPPPWSVRC